MYKRRVTPQRGVSGTARLAERCDWQAFESIPNKALREELFWRWDF